MALFRVLYRNNHYFRNVTKPLKWNIGNNFPTRVLSSNVCCRNHILQRISVEKDFGLKWVNMKQCSTQSQGKINDPKPPQEPEKKPGVVQRFKQMYKDYWYVLLPVHMTTSAIWFGSFYYCVRSGVDVIHLLETIGISDKLLTPLKESSAGYFALALACYKLITPVRYAATVGVTTYTIKKLTTIGWIKPVPSTERLKEMLQEKKEMLQEKKGNIQDKFNESKHHYQTQIKEKGSHVMDEMRRYKTEMRKMKNKVKKM